jgi:hypothetical protein
VLIHGFFVRYQKREIKIQEWESCQKLKFEAKLKQAEVSLKFLNFSPSEDREHLFLKKKGARENHLLIAEHVFR